MTDAALVPVNEIAGLAEVAEYLGENRNTISNWMNRSNSHNFPQPVVKIAAGPLWDMRDVRVWLKGTDGQRWLMTRIARSVGER